MLDFNVQNVGASLIFNEFLAKSCILLVNSRQLLEIKTLFENAIFYDTLQAQSFLKNHGKLRNSFFCLYFFDIANAKDFKIKYNEEKNV